LPAGHFLTPKRVFKRMIESATMDQKNHHDIFITRSDAMKSKALEVNLDGTKVQVTIDEQYHVLLKIVSDYFGIRKRMNIFLEELCHPYKNWDFIL
jgi:pyruvate,orthophosphate dikinase